MGELARIDEKQREAFQFISSHARTFTWLSFGRFVYVWTGIWNLSPVYLSRSKSASHVANVSFETI